MLFLPSSLLPLAKLSSSFSSYFALSPRFTLTLCRLSPSRFRFRFQPFPSHFVRAVFRPFLANVCTLHGLSSPSPSLLTLSHSLVCSFSPPLIFISIVRIIGSTYTCACLHRSFDSIHLRNYKTHTLACRSSSLRRHSSTVFFFFLK